MGATNNSIAAQFVLGMANLVFPSYEIQRWQTVLVAYLVAILAAAINIWGPHLLNRISRFILIWNITAFFITIVVLLATNDHKQSASFVFADFQNFTGWDRAMAAIVGILQACFGMCCYDAPAHMTEEMKSASKQAPQAIILSVVLGAITGFAFLLVLCFCIGDINATQNSATGVPVIQIFYDSTGSKVAACFLASMIAVIVIIAGNNILAEGSRCVYAFARDNGLPFSKFLAKVDKKRQVPINAVLLTLIVQLALDAIDFGTSTGFETVIAISTEGFCTIPLPLLIDLPLPQTSNTTTNKTFKKNHRPLLRHGSRQPATRLHNQSPTNPHRPILPPSLDIHQLEYPRITIFAFRIYHVQFPRNVPRD